MGCPNNGIKLMLNPRLDQSTGISLAPVSRFSPSSTERHPCCAPCFSTGAWHQIPSELKLSMPRIDYWESHQFQSGNTSWYTGPKGAVAGSELHYLMYIRDFVCSHPFFGEKRTDAMNCIFLLPFYRWENWGSNKWVYFPKFTWLASGRFRYQL